MYVKPCTTHRCGLLCGLYPKSMPPQAQGRCLHQVPEPLPRAGVVVDAAEVGLLHGNKAQGDTA